MLSAPSFLYRNQCGIFCYQRRIPVQLRVGDPLPSAFFRKSLRTRNKRTALSLARKLSVMFDELAQRYFDSPEDFYNGLLLLQKEKRFAANSRDWAEYEEKFLMEELGSSEQDGNLLDLATRWKAEQKRVAPHTFSVTDVYLYDDVAKQYFQTPEELYKGIYLLSLDKLAQNRYPSWKDYEENFLHFDLKESEVDLDILNRAKEWQGYAQAMHNKDALKPYSVTNEVHRALAQRDLDSLTSISIDAAFNKFISENRQNWKSNSKSEETYKNEVLPILKCIIGDIATSKIENQHIQKYKEIVLKLPKNRRKMPAYRMLNLDQLYDLDIPEADQLSKTSKSNYLQRLSAFLEWLEKNNYCKPGLSSPLKRVIKKTTQDNEDKNAFTDDDLKALFNSKQYTTDLYVESYKYWVPLLSLLTGARTNEICQLHINDIYETEEDKLWVIDFNENDASITRKSLKRSFHKRLFPLPKILIKLGFLKFYKFQKDRNEIRLFPDLPFSGGNNKYGAKFSKWFNNTYMNSKNCNIITEKTSVYSLRHNFITYLTTKIKATEIEIAQYLGQTPKGGVTTTRYSKPINIREAAKLFSKVNYEGVIDFNIIREWRN